ncbi:hypothetical protein MHYP_G00096700 [Metynnis hypsauchen]
MDTENYLTLLSVHVFTPGPYITILPVNVYHLLRGWYYLGWGVSAGRRHQPTLARKLWPCASRVLESASQTGVESGWHCPAGKWAARPAGIAQGGVKGSRKSRGADIHESEFSGVGQR